MGGKPEMRGNLEAGSGVSFKEGWAHRRLPEGRLGEDGGVTTGLLDMDISADPKRRWL